jgi:hypothetical protein
MNSFISKYKAYFISLGIAIALCLTAFFVIHWEIDRAKARAFEKAKVITKEVVTAPEKADKASKVAGRAIFEVKNFKNKISEEVKRLEDSTKN